MRDVPFYSRLFRAPLPIADVFVQSPGPRRNAAIRSRKCRLLSNVVATRISPSDAKLSKFANAKNRIPEPETRRIGLASSGELSYTKVREFLRKSFRSRERNIKAR